MVPKNLDIEFLSRFWARRAGSGRRRRCRDGWRGEAAARAAAAGGAASARVAEAHAAVAAAVASSTDGRTAGTDVATGGREGAAAVVGKVCT